MAKKKSKFNTRNTVVFSVIGALLIFAGIFIYAKDSKKASVESRANNEVNNTVIQADVKDGVYTNYTYGFSFRYPNDIFEQKSSTYFNSIEEDAEIVFGFFNDISNTTNSDVSSKYVNLYNDCISLSNNELVDDKSIKFVLKNSFGCGVETELSTSLSVDVNTLLKQKVYYGLFKLDDNLILVNLTSRSLDSHYRNTFEEIMNSFDYNSK